MIVCFQLGVAKRIKFMGNSSKIGYNKRTGFLNSKYRFITIVATSIVIIDLQELYYRYEFIRSETRPTAQLSYTNILSNSNAISMVTKIGFVTLTLVGFGMLSYIIANKLDRLSEFNQS